MVRTPEQMICRLPMGDAVYRYEGALVLPFEGRRRKVMSTAGHNGGYQENLSAVFNYQSHYNYCGHEEDAPMPFEQYIRGYVGDTLQLDYETVTGMATIVSMDNVSIRTRRYRDVEVTALTTASLEVNGGRVCDPADYFEEKGKPNATKVGTINILLCVNVDMTPGSMARAIVTLTEAKTAAIQELMGESVYTHGLATGSGSDSVIIVADAESDHLLTYAGKHGKLGEMIGYTVKETVKEALGKHMNLTPQSRHSFLSRLHRFGVKGEAFESFPEKIDRDGMMVSLAALYAHALDQLDWELLSGEEVGKICAMLIGQMASRVGIDYAANETAADMDALIAQVREFALAIVKAHG